MPVGGPSPFVDSQNQHRGIREPGFGGGAAPREGYSEAAGRAPTCVSAGSRRSEQGWPAPFSLTEGGVVAEVRLREWPVGPVRRRSSGRAALAERERALARAPLFSSLPARKQRPIARVTGVWTYPQGSVIVQEGKPGASFFVITEGRA